MQSTFSTSKIFSLCLLQVVVFVRESENFDKMSDFYNRLIPREPSDILHSDPGGSYQVHPLSRRAELMLVDYPGLRPTVCSNISLHIQVTGSADSRVTEAKQINAQEWQVTDPEGNVVTLFTALK